MQRLTLSSFSETYIPLVSQKVDEKIDFCCNEDPKKINKKTVLKNTRANGTIPFVYTQGEPKQLETCKFEMLLQ